MQRFFLSSEAFKENFMTFTPAQARQMARVLRMRPGEQVVALDNTGASYLVRLQTVTPNEVIGLVEQVVEEHTEPRLQITLCQALLKGEKWEYVLQKGTEVGISAFVPLVSQRCDVRLAPADWERRRPRWEQIIQEAAEQSQRAKLPRLLPPLQFREALRSSDPVLLFHPTADALPLSSLAAEARDWGAVMLLVGPEGGFDPAEAALAATTGVRTVGLGPRVLRAETAGVVAAALLLQLSGDMG